MTLFSILAFKCMRYRRRGGRCCADEAQVDAATGLHHPFDRQDTSTATAPSFAFRRGRDAPFPSPTTSSRRPLAQTPTAPRRLCLGSGQERSVSPTRGSEFSSVVWTLATSEPAALPSLDSSPTLTSRSIGCATSYHFTSKPQSTSPWLDAVGDGRGLDGGGPCALKSTWSLDSLDSVMARPSGKDGVDNDYEQHGDEDGEAELSDESSFRCAGAATVERGDRGQEGSSWDEGTL